MNRTGTITSTSIVPSSTTSITLALAKGREEITITNASTANLYVKLGPAASLTDYTFKLNSGDTYFGGSHNGIITGIWDALNGNANIAEIS